MDSNEIITQAGTLMRGDRDGLFLASSYHYPLFFYVIYLLYTTIIGPRSMKDKKPYELRSIMTLYNIFQVACNGWLLYCILVPANGISYFWNCHCTERSEVDDIFLTKSSGILYFYYLTKITDLLDTVFMVLKKKDNQITFLHLYHHSTMVLFSWYSVSYHPERRMTIYAALNCAVHVIMYFYYFLAAMGPTVQKYLWWKKYITKIQIVQFLIILWDLGSSVLRGCLTDHVFFWMWSFVVMSVLILFLNFYSKAYKDAKSVQDKKKKAQKEH